MTRWRERTCSSGSPVDHKSSNVDHHEQRVAPPSSAVSGVNFAGWATSATKRRWLNSILSQCEADLMGARLEKASNRFPRGVPFNPVTDSRGETKMTTRIFAIVPAMVLALSATAALAQPAAQPWAQFDQASLIDHGTALGPRDDARTMVSSVAYVSDGADPSYLRVQHELMNEPGYSIGTGAAHLSDGSDPSYLRNQQEVVREPGYSIGTGAALVGGA
jgi:hypothetical protein